MNVQEAFDTSTRGIIAQGGPAYGAINGIKCCLYRDPATGRKCAFGQILPDDLYNPVFEGRGVSSVVTAIHTGIFEKPSGEKIDIYFKDETFLADVLAPSEDAPEYGATLLRKLQEAHDYTATLPGGIWKWSLWRDFLTIIVREFRLSDAVLAEIPQDK